MADLNLSETAWHRSRVDGAAAVKTPAFGIAISIMGVLFAAVALVVSEGDPISTQAGAVALFGVLAIALTLLCVFAVPLVAAPVRQRDELREALGNRGVKTVNVDVTIQDAHRRGKEMAERFAKRRSVDVPQRQEAEAWTTEVVDLLAAHAPEGFGQQFIAAGEGETETLPRLRQRVETLDRLIGEMS
jgi:hypothetical protein